MLLQCVLVVKPCFTLVTVVSNALMFGEFMPLEVSLLCELFITLVTVILHTFVLCHLVSPQVADVTKLRLTQVTIIPGGPGKLVWYWRGWICIKLLKRIVLQ